MATEIVMPALEMAQETGTLVRWLKSEGASVRKGEPLMEIETDKAVMEIEAPETGILASLSAEAGQTIKVGHVIGLLLTEQEYVENSNRRIGASVQTASATKTRQTPSSRHEAQSQSSSDPVSRLKPASPKARRLAAEHGIDIATLTGSGPAGELIAADLEPLLQAETVPQEQAEFSVVPLSRMRSIIADRLQRSNREAPHIALTVSIDMDRTMHWIRDFNERRASGRALKLSAVLAKAVAITLVRFPRLNAHFVNDGIREYKPVHLGVAVALEDGLLVPTLRDADKKSLVAIQAEQDDLFERARAGHLRLDEIKGSTFTISNLGMFGIEQFSAILNPPEVAILSVGVVKDTPAVANGQIVVRPMMQTTVNVDHRAVDGSAAAKFLDALRRTLEIPDFLSETR